MQLKISISIGGEFKGSKIVTLPCFIGRSKEAGLTISHPSVSRKHCELLEEEGKIFLRDSGSLNGTLLKGEFVEGPVEIQLGDEFVIGDLLIRLEPPTVPASSEAAVVAGDAEADPAMVTLINPANVASFGDEESKESIEIVGNCFNDQ